MKLKKFCWSLLIYTLVVAAVDSTEPYGNIVVNVKAAYDLSEKNEKITGTNCGKWKSNFEKKMKDLQSEIAMETKQYICIKKVNLYVPSSKWDFNCAPGISQTTVKINPDVLIAPMVTKDLIKNPRIFTRTPGYCRNFTNSRVVICPFKFIDDYFHNEAHLVKELLDIKYANQIGKFDCNKFFFTSDVANITNKQRVPIDDCDSSHLVFEYFYYEKTKQISATPQVKVTSDGIDAAINVTCGGKELDGVSVKLKVQGADVKNVEMENSGDVYRAQVTGLTPGKYDLVFFITGQNSTLKGVISTTQCCIPPNTYCETKEGKGQEFSVYGADGFTSVGNFTLTESRSVQVGSPGLPTTEPAPKPQTTESAPSPRTTEPAPKPQTTEPAPKTKPTQPSVKPDVYTQSTQNYNHTDSPPENDKSQLNYIVMICLIVLACLAGLAALGVIVKYWMDNNKIKKKKRKSKEDLEEDEGSAEDTKDNESNDV